MPDEVDPLADFHERYQALTGFRPMAWQRRLYADHFVRGALPRAIDLPTGLGKTAVMAIWYLAYRRNPALPRRLVYVVDRRAVVDQATEEAERIEQRAEDPDLGISTLRGKRADNKAWLENPAAPAIVVGTVDMIGSRLLFEGYGVSRRMRPYHAGLLGADTLVVLDESHLVPPFERLLEQIARKSDLGPKEAVDRQCVPRFHLLPLSATGHARNGDVFRLAEEDRRQDEIVCKRLEAKKRLTFVDIEEEDELKGRLAVEAWKLTDQGRLPRRILVYCNSRKVAENTKARIEDLAKGDKKAGVPQVDVETELFVGARRVREREHARQRLADLGFLAGSDCQADKPAFVVATSAGEVGVDLDADHMAMDLAPFERMVQRLGRVNRLGHKDATVIAVCGEPKPKKPDAPTAEEQAAMIAWRARQFLETSLPRHDDGSSNASPLALVRLKEAHASAIGEVSTPAPLYPALTRALVDAWSMTSLKEHTGRPEIAPWLRGWVEEEPQTTLVWRQYLPIRLDDGVPTTREIESYFAAAPPHLAEMLEARTDAVRDWLIARIRKLAVEGGKPAHDEADLAESELSPLRRECVVAVLLGRGNELKRCYTLGDLQIAAAEKAAFLRSLAGMTLVLDARLGGLSSDGLLDKSIGCEPTSAADVESGWLISESQGPVVPFRVKRVRSSQDHGDGQDEPARASDESAKWRPIHAFDQQRDEDGRPVVQLIVEKWHEAEINENARSVASRPQGLEEHQNWTGRRARQLVTDLRLDDGLGNAIVLAARLHDEGKRAQRWQDAFHTPRSNRPYAKTGSRRPPDLAVLGGYRHEFGSLARVEQNNEFGALPDQLMDLVLHLVAAHHGRARPVIGTDGCDDGPPSVLEDRACNVALRFARLQKRFGPWGLAWLEAVLRAADQQASRDLDEGSEPGG